MENTQAASQHGMPADLSSGSLLHTVESYIRYYASGNGHTARAKRLDLNHFLDFLCSIKGYSKPEKLKVFDWDHSAVQRFVDESLAQGESPATAARRLATIKHMGRTLSEKIAGFINPAREVKTPKIKPGKPKALSESEINLVRQKAEQRLSDKHSFNRLRNETLFCFMLDTGLRAEEVRLLKLGQLDESLEWIKNVRTKGKRYRNVYVTSEVRSQLKIYLAARKDKLDALYKKQTKSHDRSLPLFISAYNAVPGKPETFLMGAKSIWRAINEFSTETRLHPHLLRHSYAMDLLDSSNDIRLVAQALGHSDVRITMRYTERTEEQIAEALEKSREKKKLINQLK
jgi:site-specific recombinase XerD